MTLESLTEFFGWMLAINLGVLTLSSVGLLFLRDFAVKLHSRMFKLEEGVVREAYFRYLAQLKIAVIVFSFVPYLALRFMSSAA